MKKIFKISLIGILFILFLNTNNLTNLKADEENDNSLFKNFVYEDVMPHGCGYTVEIWYTKIDNNTHSAYCCGCGEEWIESHNNSCRCI